MAEGAGNGSVSFTVKELLGKLDVKLDNITLKLDGKVDRDNFDHLEKRVSVLEEERRLDLERVKVAAQTLEAQRVERARALETPVRTWGLRSNKANVVYLLILSAVILYGVLHPHL